MTLIEDSAERVHDDLRRIIAILDHAFTDIAKALERIADAQGRRERAELPTPPPTPPSHLW